MRVLSYCRAGGEAEFWLCLKKKNHDRVKKKLLFRVAILNCTHMSKITEQGQWVWDLVCCGGRWDTPSSAISSCSGWDLT